MGVDVQQGRTFQSTVIPLVWAAPELTRVPVAMRAWVAGENGAGAHIVSHVGEDAVELVGAVSGLTIGETVAISLRTETHGNIVLSASVHRADKGKAVLWFDRPSDEAHKRLVRFVNDARIGNAAARRGGLYEFLHAA